MSSRPLAPIRDGGPEALGEAARFEPEIEPMWDELDLFSEAVPTSVEPPGFASRDLAEPAPPPYADSPEDDLRSRVLALLGPTPLPIDEVIRMSGLAPRVVLAALTELELDGDALRLDGSRVALRIG